MNKIYRSQTTVNIYFMRTMQSSLLDVVSTEIDIGLENVLRCPAVRAEEQLQNLQWSYSYTTFS